MKCELVLLIECLRRTKAPMHGRGSRRCRDAAQHTSSNTLQQRTTAAERAPVSRCRRMRTAQQQQHVAAAEHAVRTAAESAEHNSSRTHRKSRQSQSMPALGRAQPPLPMSPSSSELDSPLHSTAHFGGIGEVCGVWLLVRAGGGQCPRGQHAAHDVLRGCLCRRGGRRLRMIALQQYIGQETRLHGVCGGFILSLWPPKAHGAAALKSAERQVPTGRIRRSWNASELQTFLDTDLGLF